MKQANDEVLHCLPANDSDWLWWSQQLSDKTGGKCVIVETAVITGWVTYCTTRKPQNFVLYWNSWTSECNRKSQTYFQNMASCVGH